MSLREAHVDLAAVRHNVAVLGERVGVPVLAIVKADAYGHGAAPVAAAALEAGAAGVGVADLDEARVLRAAGVRGRLLAWIHGADADIAGAVEAQVELGVSTREQLERAAAAGATVHLKTDTGLSRNGFAAAECEEVFARAAELERAGALRVAGIFSHLANAGEAEDLAQVRAFEGQLALARAAGLQPQAAHLAATAGALRVPAARFDLVRIGLGIYGLSPFDDETSADLGLRPAMTVTAEVVAVRRVPAGTGVSYGFAHRTAAPTTLALVGMGYADGLPRAASGRAHVSIGGVRHPVRGRIAMDQIIVDVADHPVQVGDRAVLFGDPAEGVPSAEEWGEWAGTINYEIVTRIGPRVRRVHAP